MLRHYLEKYNKSDVACRKVDHTHTTHQPALVRATHLLLEKTITNSVNGTLQTRHTVDRGELILIS